MSRIGYKLYERPNSPFWWVYFSIAGKPFRVSTRVPLARRGDAEKKAAQILVSRFDSRDGAPIPAAVAGLSLKQLSEMWISHLQTERQASRKLIERITTDMGQYVERLWAHPTEVTPAAWRAVSYDPDTREAGRLHHSKGGRLKWGSIAHLGNTLRHFLRFCAKKGAISVVPEIHLPPGKLQKLDRAPRAAMEQATREKLIATLLEMGEEKAGRVYTALFETWVRRSTLRAMTPRWIDWKAETITLPAQFNKSRREKQIDMTPRAAAAIKAQIAANALIRPTALDEPIFGHFDYKNTFRTAIRRAGIDDYGLTPHHTTRHSALTWAGANPEATISGMMKQAGLDSAAVIEQNYLHPSLDAARAITRK